MAAAPGNASTLVPAAAAATGASAASSAREPARPQELRVYVVDDASTAPRVLEVAMTEAGKIWGGAGLHLRWASPPSTPYAPDGQSIIVIVRHQLRPVRSASAAASHGRTRKPLGWLMFDENGCPGMLIEVSFGEVASLVEKGSHMTFRIAALPDAERNRILGRGLGRVIAHEIGHWLIGRGHMRTGLMKANFSTHDLVDATLPELPTTWPAAVASIAITSSSQCACVQPFRTETCATRSPSEPPPTHDEEVQAAEAAAGPASIGAAAEHSASRLLQKGLSHRQRGAARQPGPEPARGEDPRAAGRAGAAV